MSEYSETVRFNLDRLDNEEIAQKIKNKALTDEALEIAKSILIERGIDASNTNNINNVLIESRNADVKNSIQLGINPENILKWIVSAFLFGISLKYQNDINSTDTNSAMLFKSGMGISLAIVTFIIISIYSYFTRNNFIPTDKLIKKYNSSTKSIMTQNFIAIIFLLVSIYFSIYFEVMPILSIVVLVIFSILTFGIYKKYHHAKYLLLLLYFIIPMLSLIVAPFSKFGWFWSFGLFYVFDSILIERINFKYNLKQVSE